MNNQDEYNEDSDPDTVGWAIVVIAYAAVIIALCAIFATCHYIKTV